MFFRPLRVPIDLPRSFRRVGSTGGAKRKDWNEKHTPSGESELSTACHHIGEPARRPQHPQPPGRIPATTRSNSRQLITSSMMIYERNDDQSTQRPRWPTCWRYINESIIIIIIIYNHTDIICRLIIWHRAWSVRRIAITCLRANDRPCTSRIFWYPLPLDSRKFAT